jgi:Asp/Glu/hydantoin racemase
MVLMNKYTPEALARRKAVVEASTSAGVEVGYAEIEGSGGGASVTDLHRAMVAPAAGRAALAAERAGYDAVVAWGTLDLGVEEGRHLVDIPLIGPGRVAASIAATLCQRFAVLAYSQKQIVMFRKAMRGWGLEAWAVDYRHVDMPPMEIPAHAEEVKKKFVAEARKAVRERQAELILPLGYSIVPLTLKAADLAEEIGVPVIDPLPITMRLAEALAASGFKNSRAAYPAVKL